MSVVVRMEMPQNCINCDLRYECNSFYAPGKPKPFMKGCRIVCQLPEGHGRLADADKLMKDWQTWRSGMYAIASIAMIDQVINDLRCAVIAPAEAESPSPKPSNPLPIHVVEYVPTEVDAQTGIVTYELRERSET